MGSERAAEARSGAIAAAVAVVVESAGETNDDDDDDDDGKEDDVAAVEDKIEACDTSASLPIRLSMFEAAAATAATCSCVMK